MSLEPFRPPPASLLWAAFALPRLYFSPVFRGLERLDLSRPALWVGNHTLYGLIDVPLLAEYLFREHGVTLRPLGDRGHLKVPFWGELLKLGGMVLGTPEVCRELMRRGEHVLVFPGGEREVFRRSGDGYRLFWRRRTGFVRLAIEHGYDIIPFASVGPNEVFDIVLDGEAVMRSRLWQLLSSVLPLASWSRDGDMIPPVVRGLGLMPLPRPQRFYLGFGDRISTRPLAGRVDDADAVWALRGEVASAVEALVQVLLAERAADFPRWSAVRRALAPLPRAAGRASGACEITGTLCEMSGTRICFPERESAGAAGQSPSHQPLWRVARAAARRASPG
jgi:1-acyl-sn-glycerol-3-phosphate acyltransferase